MARQFVRIEATGIFKFEYDPKSKLFIEALKDFNDLIAKHSTAEDMLKHVAFHINRFSIESMVEGVGYVHLLKDKSKPKEPFSGIYVHEEEPDFEFEMIDY